MRTAARAAVAVMVIGVALSARGDFGDPLPKVSPGEHDAFVSGQTSFATAETPAEGLGPVFNDVSCAACHTGPGSVFGGNTTRTETRFGTITGGTFDALAGLGGSLQQTSGIGSEAVSNKGTCKKVFFVGEEVPAQATIRAGRRTTPLFGLGLVDATPDSTLRNLAASEPAATRGIANPVPKSEAQQQNLVGRFGWKAQNATLHVFAGDAYVNEMGITNPTFPTENCPQGDCSNLVCLLAPELNDANGADVAAFTDFMTFLAPPPRGPIDSDVQQGEQVFARIGCADCHTQTLTTAPNPTSAALDAVTYHPYSDFLLHDMGTLGDGIMQGNAGGTLMRTAPLWGLRTQRTLLHDGRTSSVSAAIDAHDGQGAAARAAFDKLSATQRTSLLAFLASL